jgi:hypothetical protein
LPEAERAGREPAPVLGGMGERERCGGKRRTGKRKRTRLGQSMHRRTG